MSKSRPQFSSSPCYAHQFEDYCLGQRAPHQHDGEAISARLVDLRRRIVGACARAGRDPGSVRLLPVSKTVPAERLRAAVAATGFVELAENKVQEAAQKAEALVDLKLRWVVIGHLQSNKAKPVARFASEFQALDRLALADSLQRRLERENRSLDVLVQINTSGEASKFGVTPEQALPLLRALPAHSRLRVRGLMTLAVFSTDAERVRACFRQLRKLRDQLRDVAIAGVALDELSMGMSGDFEIAIEEGATTVRIGQALFGPRLLPDSYYWPEPPDGEAGSSSPSRP